MHFLRVLYALQSYDDLILQLKQAFGSAVENVSVNTLVEDQMIELTWNDLLNPNELAMCLTEKIPDIILETTSDTGIDLYSRYFNGTQLW